MMDFSDYAGLQAAVADYLNRNDLTTTGQIAAFIALAEAKIRRRLRRVTASGTLTFASGELSQALPADVAELRSMSLPASATLPRGGSALKSVSIEQLAYLRSILPQTGIPRYFAVLNRNVYVAPVPADQYLDFTTTYFVKYTPLSDAAPTNDLLTDAPDLFLYGACVESAPYLEHDEREPMWKSKFDDAIDELNEQRQREEFGASLTAARLPMVIG